MNNLEKVVDAANAALREGTEHGSTSELYDALQKLLMVASGYLDNDRQNKPVLWGVRRDGVLLASYRDKDEAEDDAERYGGELCALSYMTTVPSPELCGCGRPGDYMASDGGLCCNKYDIRCNDKPAAVADAEEDAYVIDKLAKLLAEIAVIVNGPEPPLTSWSYHDLPEKVRALKQAPPNLGAYSAVLAQRLDKVLARHAYSMPIEAYAEVDAVMRALDQQAAVPKDAHAAMVPRNLNPEMREVLTRMLTNCRTVDESYRELLTAAERKE